jgi:hypothetical protein
MASAHLAAGRYDEALSWAEMAMRTKPGYLLAPLIAAASAALAGRGEAMRKAMVLVHQNDPQLRLSNLKEVISYLQPAEFARGKTVFDWPACRNDAGWLRPPRNVVQRLPSRRPGPNNSSPQGALVDFLQNGFRNRARSLGRRRKILKLKRHIAAPNFNGS